jgi:Fe2+ transport system protein B
MSYRRRYYRHGRREKSPQEKADQARCELYWQVRREISNESEKLRLRLSDHLINAITSAIISVPIVGFIFWFAFPFGPYRGWPRDETMHDIVVLAMLVAAIGLPGAVINELLWPKILKIAGFVVVAVAFYFGLQARANLLYVIPYFLCCWISAFAYSESGRLRNKILEFENKKLTDRSLDPKERDRLIGPPQ